MSRATTPKTEFRPSAALIKKARQHLAHYSFVIQPAGDGGFAGSVNELPGVIADGQTHDQCARNLSFALETVIASYLNDGQSPPKPASRE